MFNSSEVLFLSMAHGGSKGEQRNVPGMVALTTGMQIPEQILQGILERRASKLGRTFEEFRASQKPATVPSAPKAVPAQNPYLTRLI